jgi:hypothetical protein
MRVLMVGLLLGVFASPALAFQETTTGTAQGTPPAAAAAPDAEPPKATVEPGKGLNFKVPEVSIGSGTQIHIPGLGTVGVLPKLDFGLELLYGASDPKGMPPDRNEDDVQIRGTIKHRF